MTYVLHVVVICNIWDMQYNIGISLPNIKIRIIKINFHFGILEKLEKTFNRMIKNKVPYIL